MRGAECIKNAFNQEKNFYSKIIEQFTVKNDMRIPLL